MDMIPGMVTYFWLTPTRTGNFEILCAELCGTGHHTMRGNVVVDNDADYQAWLSEQQTFAQSLAKMDDGLIKTARSGTRQETSRSPRKVNVQ